MSVNHNQKIPFFLRSKPTWKLDASLTINHGLIHS